MTALLDAVYSSGFFMFGAAIFFTVLVIVIGIKSPLHRLKPPLVVKILYILIPVILFLVLFQFPLGYGFIIHDMLITGNRLVFYDYRQNRRLPRLHVVNADTGEPVYRTHFTNPPLFFRTRLEQRPELYSIRDDNLLMRRGPEFLVYDIQSRRDAVNLSGLSLMKKYGELSGGVENVAYDKAFRLLRVFAKNGKRYYIDPYSGKMVDSPVKETSSYEKYSCNSMIKKNGSTLIYFDNKNNSHIMEVLKHADGKNRNSGVYEFIDPDFILLDSESEIFIVRSYEKTDKENFMLTGFNMKLDRLWQIKRSNLKTDVPFSFIIKKGNKLFPHIKYGGNMIFAVGGVVYSLDIKTGTVSWSRSF